MQALRPLPAVFSMQHTPDAGGYLFSVKDTTDPCGFALFSDHMGIIYVAAAMR